MNDLEYLTVDSIQWATGYVRPRMAPEEKRAKHRIHQQQFMLRQRQRIEQLQRDVQRYTLQLKMVEASQEAAKLVSENEAMQKQLHSTDSPYPVENATLLFQVPTQDDSTSATQNEESVMLELLDMLPDVKTLNVDSPSDSREFLWREDHVGEPLVWPSSPSCSTSFLELLG